MHTKNTLYRMYEPGIKVGWLFIKCILQAILFASFDILTILVFRWMAIYAEQQNIYYLQIIARGFLLVCVAHTILKYIIKHWGRAESWFPIRGRIFKTYMKKFFYLDYTTIEKYGTGRLIYMISKGADERTGAVIDTVYSFIDIGA